MGTVFYKKEKGRRRPRICAVLLCWMLIISGCSGAETDTDDKGTVLSVYYVNNNETAILSREHELKADPEDTEAAVEELLSELATVPEHLEYEAPLSGDGSLTEYTVGQGMLTLSFGEDYMQMDRTTEVLDRAAVVRTLTQLPGVDNVTYQVAGAPLSAADGSVIGSMTAGDFIYNAGNEINAYERVELGLYFATEDGTELIEVYRSVVYNSNISMQRLAVEQLIGGPNIDVAHPTINPQTRINSIAVRDGVCYVDLDDAFLVPVGGVTPEVAVYSIVNTLAELSGVNKVQISVNGNNNATFMESLSLGTVFERDLDLIAQ